MLIECLTMREGITPVPRGKREIIFQPLLVFDKKTGKPIPGPTTSWADITKEEDIKYFLDPRRGNMYRPLEGNAIPMRYADPPVNKLQGYAFISYGEGIGELLPGYIGQRTIKGQKQYMGQDGIWKTERKGLTPFKTELDAYNFVKEQADMEEEEEPLPQPIAQNTFANTEEPPPKLPPKTAAGKRVVDRILSNEGK